MVTTIIILSVLVGVLSYTSYNLLRKNEKCEDIISSYEEHLTNLSNLISFSDKKLKEVDTKGSFESDDEVGFFFKHILFIQEELNKFKINKNV
jgi:hypothetical protein